jgi:hypothetical protein
MQDLRPRSALACCYRGSGGLAPGGVPFHGERLNAGTGDGGSAFSSGRQGEWGWERGRVRVRSMYL